MHATTQIITQLKNHRNRQRFIENFSNETRKTPKIKTYFKQTSKSRIRVPKEKSFRQLTANTTNNTSLGQTSREIPVSAREVREVIGNRECASGANVRAAQSANDYWTRAGHTTAEQLSKVWFSTWLWWAW